MEFTFNAYKKLINHSLKNGYKICSYKNADNYSKSMIIRHDIDFSPQKALKIAKIEYELGVKSTYFVLLSTEFYNIFSKETAYIFSEISDMGHEIGLHFDEQRYELTSVQEIQSEVYREIEILEKALYISVNTVSMHRPSKFTLENNIDFNDVINSYKKKYFEDMKYISDSRMNWRENPLSVISNNNYKKIHILTHPFWYSNKPERVQDKILSFINDSKINRYKQISNNFRNLEEYINEEDIL